jgi:hypothetical protein
MGSRYDKVLPEPVCDWTNTSLELLASGNIPESAERCIAVGFSIPILEARCWDINGLRPNPLNVEESVNGAFEGLAADLTGLD